MKIITIFLLCTILFTGCGSVNQTSNHSIPPVTTTQETSPESLQNVSVSTPPNPTPDSSVEIKIEETVSPTLFPTAEAIVETPQPIPENLYPPDRIFVEASEEDRKSWTSTVHFTEPEDKYISLTYDNERLCFDRTVDEIYGPDVITNYGNFYSRGANFELAYSHAIKSRWQVAQEDSAWKYVASCPRESGSIEIYMLDDWGYYIFYECGPYSLAQIWSRFGITEDNLKRSNFEDIFDYVSCIGEITVTEGKYDYELPYLQTYEVVDVTPYDMYISVRGVLAYDRPNTSYPYKIADLKRNDKVTVTGYCVSPDNHMVRVIADGREMYISDIVLSGEPLRHLKDVRDELWAEYKTTVSPKQPGSEGYKRGDELVFDSSLILPYSKCEIPILNQFNTAGLNTDYYNGMYGYQFIGEGIFVKNTPAPGEETSETVLDNWELTLSNMDALRWVWADEDMLSEEGHQGFTVGSDHFDWYFNSFDSYPDISVEKPDDGENYYTFTLRYPLTVEAGEKLDWTMNETVVKTGQEVVIVLLSSISSTPMEIYECLMFNLYEAKDGEETLSENWTVVGDCQIMVDFSKSSYKQAIWTFYIKPK